MKVMNLTPHTVNIFGMGLSGYEEIVSLPSQGLARCQVEREKTGEIKEANDRPSLMQDSHGWGIDLFDTKYGEVTGLPDPEPDTIYIVSLLVRQAIPDREDLYSPGELLRDENGNPKGCLGLSR